MLFVIAAEPTVRGLQLGTLNALLFLGLALAWRYRHRGWVVAVALPAVVIAKLFNRDHVSPEGDTPPRAGAVAA